MGVRSNTENRQVPIWAASWYDHHANNALDKGIAQKITPIEFSMHRMIQKICAIVLLLAASLAAHASTGDWLKSHNGKLYAVARAELMAAGYIPVRFAHPSNSDACSGREWCVVYPETVTCSGTGIALCQFAFHHRKSGKYLAVVTHGETRLTTLRMFYLTRSDRLGWDPQTH